MDSTLLIIAATLAVINVLVSIFLFTRDDLEKFQKIAQTVIVWLVPFVGALVMWLFNKSQVINKPKSKAPLGGGSPYEHID
ncbi:hypothetical protein tinsulaeT_38820 [Thalassotalea insulae]|uniref:Cardiolipin synthase N-terminal domain-containing protein n=1 Tax=Thalassotalea insulae TaxID=2056778 RepID=A0ABQ6GYY5_9GAMM|nr:hypothetical protein [Thalassotalea insulae]GLX80542.1 hypothetical protein tinsulaeT_38820 [Thalassotalea insulae]